MKADQVSNSHPVSPHHFAELKEMYDKQLLAYETACKKLPIVAKTYRQSGVPNDLPTLKKFLEAGKRNRKRKQNKREVSLCTHVQPYHSTSLTLYHFKLCQS